MYRTKVSSSNLSAVGYNSFQMILEIEFNDGAVYQYFGVPQNVHSGLMSAASHGKYFHAYIRNNYRCARVR